MNTRRGLGPWSAIFVLALAHTAHSHPSWRVPLGRALDDAQYSFQAPPGEANAWTASNPVHGLAISLSCDGLTVVPRIPVSPTTPDWRLEVRTSSLGRSEFPVDVEPVSVAAEGSRLELDHGVLLEWFENGSSGLEQGWTIPVRPEGAGPLRLGIELTGDLALRIDESARGGALVDARGVVRLRYDDLLVHDAAGRELGALLEPSATGFRIRVDDSAAVYPITVDPLLGDPDWSVESDQVEAGLGSSSSTAGDVNGDGYDDVIVAAYMYDSGNVNEGRAYLHLGSAGGLATNASWSAEGNEHGAFFGFAVACAGDVDGDGFDDVLVGAPRFDSPQTSEGRAFLYRGSAGGLEASAAWTAESNLQGAEFASSVSTAGDVNGDGYADVIVGAREYYHPDLDEGAAFVYLGSATGLASAAAWTFEGDRADARLGWSVSTAGDVNGDGFDDVIVSAPRFDTGAGPRGRVLAFHGSAAGLAATPDWVVDGDQTSAFFGGCVATAGDVNGDGYDDVLVGAPAYQNASVTGGRVFLYLGSPSGLSMTAAWTEGSDVHDSYFGVSAGSMGDMDGDSRDEVIVGASGNSDETIGAGRTFLYRGVPTGLAATADWTATLGMQLAHFGSSAGTAGDVNGDGYPDLLVGAWGYAHGQSDEGGAFLYLACADIGTEYCTSVPNSTGAPADISAWCSSSSSAGELRLEARAVPDGFGVFVHGANKKNIPFGNGVLCTGDDLAVGAVLRASDQLAAYTYDGSDSKHDLSGFIGSTRHFQYWFRDPVSGGANFNTSNAISIAIDP